MSGRIARLLGAVVIICAVVLPATASQAAPGDRMVSGTVLGNNGQPVQGAGVAFCRADLPPCNGSPTHAVLASPTGSFSQAVDSVYGYTLTPFVPNGGGGFLTGATTQVSPGAAHVTDVALTLPLAGSTPVNTRPVTGMVLGTGNVVLGNAGLSLCPGVTWSNPCVGGQITIASPTTGQLSFMIDPTKDYRFIAFANGGSTVSDPLSPFEIAAGTDSHDVGTIILEAGPSRTLSGQVLDGEGDPIAGASAQGTQAWACPQPGPTGGSCKGRATAFADPSTGAYVLTLDSSKDWAVSGVSVELGVRSHPELVSAGTTDVSGLDFALEYGTITGSVGRTGFTTPFARDVIGVGACPTSGTGTGALCFGVQAGFAAPDGTFSFRLPPGEYRMAGFMYVDGALVIGEVETGVIVEGGTYVKRDGSLNEIPWSADPPDTQLSGDGNGDGTDDATQADVATIAPPPEEAGGALTMAAAAVPGAVTVDANGASLTNVVATSLSELETVPELDAPWGALSFTVAVAPGGTATVDLYFEEEVPYGASYLKWDAISEEWIDFDGFTRTGPHTARLTLTDGVAPGDYDGQVNGFITDPGIPDLTAAAAPDFELGGFGKPLKASNSTKAGANVPIKWRVTEGGVASDDAGSFESLTVAACGGSEAVSVPGTPVYKGDGWWQLDWKVPKGTSGCRQVVVTLVDGDSISTTFNVKR